MRLEFDISRCLRAKSKFSSCTLCIKASPEHITLVENLPSFKNQTGLEAAVAIGVCPCEALSMSGISLSQFFFDFLETKNDTLSPSNQLPCLSMLSVEHLLSFALALEQNLKINVSNYDKDSIQLEQISKRVDEVNRILFLVSSKKIEFICQELLINEDNNDTQKTPSRRDFLANLSLKGALKQKKRYEEFIVSDEMKEHKLEGDALMKLKEKNIPEKRKILLSLLKHTDFFDKSVLIETEQISFISDKTINVNCTNCQMCYRLCPSGALSSDGKFSLINFDAKLCLKCSLCHDVCEVDAIMMHAHFDLSKFTALEKKRLISFDIQRCDECGNNFTYRGGEMICPRCQSEEDGALALENKSGIIF